MSTIIRLRRSNAPGNIPNTSQLELGELAINTVDGKIFLKKLDGGIESIVEFSPNPADLLELLKTVDGTGSGLDADLLDGESGSYYLDYNNFTNVPALDANTVFNLIKTVDGAGSGLDSDLLDGQDSSFYLNYNNLFNKPIIEDALTPIEILDAVKTVDGSGSGLDADLLDGFNGADYLRKNETYTAGHHTEGRLLRSAALTNDFGNARRRGSVFTFTNVPGGNQNNSNIDNMFNGLSSFNSFSVPSTTFPIVIEFTLPRTLTFGASIGIGFGNSIWRCNDVHIEAFSQGAWVTCVNTTSNSSEDIIVSIPGNSAIGTTAVRYTLGSPANSSQMRIAHLWGYNFSSDMWSQLQMPRSGGTMYGDLTVDNLETSGTVDGRDVSVDGSKLDGIESGATADQTPTEILDAIKTVDGIGSGLDADLLDGQTGSFYLDYVNFTNTPDLSAANLLSLISTVDGTGSGLDSDFLDGETGSYYLDYNNFTNTPVLTLDSTTWLSANNTLDIQAGGINFYTNISEFSDLVTFDSVSANGIAIGSASPQLGFLLDISGNTVTRGEMLVSGSLRKFESSNFDIRNDTAGFDINLATNSGTALTVQDGSGNIGIGELNPQSLLHITGTAPQVTFEDNGVTSTITGDQTGLDYDVPTGDNHTFSVNNSQIAAFASGTSSINTNLNIGGTNGGNQLQFNNPGIGNPSIINFAKNSDTARIIVTETSNDQTEFQFYMADNPSSSGDKFNWFINSYKGAGGDWKPLEFSAYNTRINSRNTIFRGNLIIGNNRYYIANGIENQIEESKTGTLSVSVDLSSATNTGVMPFTITLTTDGTTFTAVPWVNQTPYLTDEPITGGVQIITQGIGIQFSGTTGGVAGDTYRFGVWPEGDVTVQNDMSITGNINVSGLVDGRNINIDGSKLDGIEPGATSDQTPSEILSAIRTVDGSGSNLDADLLDGLDSTYFTNYTDTEITNRLFDSAITVNSGSGIVGGGSFTLNQNFDETLTLSHADTSNIPNITSSNKTVISGLTFDEFGHTNGFSLRSLDFITPTEGNLLYVNVGGDTMTGELIVQADISQDESSFTSRSASTASTNQTTIYSFSAVSFGGAEVIITARQSINRHITKLLITHNGTIASATEYGTIYTDISLADYDVSLSAGNINILVTPSNGTTINYKIISTLISF